MKNIKYKHLIYLILIILNTYTFSQPIIKESHPTILFIIQVVTIAIDLGVIIAIIFYLVENKDENIFTKTNKY